MPTSTQPKQDDGDRAAKKRRVTAGPTDLVSATARPSAAEIRRMLPRIATAGLHDVIVNNMLTGKRIGISDLQAAQRARGGVGPSVRPKARDGWNGLSQDILHDVLSRLNVKERVKCASRICRAWNEMKHRCGLFTDLSDESVPVDENILDLLHWLPDQALATLTGIRLGGICIPFREVRDNQGVRTIFHFWSKTRRAKFIVTGQTAAATDGCFNDTEKVVLNGLEIANTELIALFNNGCGPSLKSLAMEHLSHANASSLVVNPSATHVYSGSLTSLLRRSELLEQLKMPARLVSPSGLLHSLSAIGPIDIQRTALRELDLTIPLADSTGTNEVRNRSCVLQLNRANTILRPY